VALACLSWRHAAGRAPAWVHGMRGRGELPREVTRGDSGLRVSRGARCRRVSSITTPLTYLTYCERELPAQHEETLLDPVTTADPMSMH
jgi:hypothetical protein